MAKENEKRAELAARAVRSLADVTGSDLYKDAIVDLLCNLKHLCDRENIDWTSVIHTAISTHYHEEIRLDE